MPCRACPRTSSIQCVIIVPIKRLAHALSGLPLRPPKRKRRSPTAQCQTCNTRHLAFSACVRTYVRCFAAEAHGRHARPAAAACCRAVHCTPDDTVPVRSVFIKHLRCSGVLIPSKSTYAQQLCYPAVTIVVMHAHVSRDIPVQASRRASHVPRNIVHATKCACSRACCFHYCPRPSNNRITPS